MVTRIHPEVHTVPEYDPFKDKNVIDLGPNERMNIKQALIVAYNTNLLNVVIVGDCGCGCSLIKIVASSMTTADMLMLAEKLKMAVIDRELAIDESNEYDPENTG